MSDDPIPTPAFAERLLLGYARHFPLRRGKLRLVNALWRHAAGVATSRRLAELCHGRLRMHVDITEQLQRQFYFFGTYFVEEKMLGCWTELARGSRVIFDIGANRGIYSLAALAASPHATVYAFEPTPDIAAALRKTAEFNSLVELHINEVAVSDRGGRARLVLYGGSDGLNGGMNYLAPSAGCLDTAPALEVASIRLDEFCQANAITAIELLKVDVQGHENAVIRGAGNLVSSRQIHNIFLELNWSHEGGAECSARAVVDTLSTAGYRFARPELPLRWQDAGTWIECLSDVVAGCPKS